MMTELKEILQEYTVLLAEDDEEVRKRLKNTLSFFFKEVYEASNGILAYELFLEKKPTLVISDIEMANGSGIDLVNNIRKINLLTPIIIISAYSKEEYLLKLINLKIDQYILKPATKDTLLEAISNALGKGKVTSLELVNALFLNIDNNTIKYQNQVVHLRKKEKEFLELLYQNRNKITKYSLIQEYLWADKIMSQNALKTFIKELRKKLPVNIIQNVMQEGYKLALKE